MTDPLAFLAAALDAAQRDAEAAAARAWSPHWKYDDLVREIRDLNNAGTLAVIYHPEIGNYVAAHDPASVLRRIAADRKLIDRCLAVLAEEDRLNEDVGGYLAEDAIRYLAEGWGWTEGTT